MAAAFPTPVDPLQATVAWIERQLDQPLTLEQVAQHAGLSPYHFSRVFTARMGRSVMAHVRGRRLVRAARRLCAEPRLKLVDLALDSGFESQEAFTRAFKRLFGVSPGRFRTGFAVDPIEGQFPMSMPPAQHTAVAQLPERVTLPAFHVAGPARRFDDTTKAQIPQLWAALGGALPFAGQLPSWDTYGLVSSANRAEGSFQYMAGVGVEPGCTPPAGFSTVRIEAATYVVFRITLNGTALHPQVKAAMATIWGTLIPASGLQLADAPDFELYDGRFDPQQQGAVIDFYVPVVG